MSGGGDVFTALGRPFDAYVSRPDAHAPDRHLDAIEFESSVTTWLRDSEKSARCDRSPTSSRKAPFTREIMAARPENVGISTSSSTSRSAPAADWKEEQDGCAAHTRPASARTARARRDPRGRRIDPADGARAPARCGTSSRRTTTRRLEVGTETLVELQVGEDGAARAALRRSCPRRRRRANPARAEAALFHSRRVGRVVGVGRLRKYAVVVCRRVAVYEAGPARRRAAAATSRCSSAPTRRSRSPARG